MKRYFAGVATILFLTIAGCGGTTPPSCGTLNAACCTTGTACSAAGTTCQMNVCKMAPTCGATGGACCANMMCNNTTDTCTNGVCTTMNTMCGMAGQVCCTPNNTCQQGTCTNGMCATGTALIGDACTTAAMCAEGTKPVCWKNLFASANYLPTKGGYCSSKCTSDADCGSGVCTDFGQVGMFCMKACSAATDCRADGYACFTNVSQTSAICFPNTNLDCDPTAPGGTCSNMNVANGGCLRQALGTGNTGQCNPLCDVGLGTCPPLSGGQAQVCNIEDDRWTSAGKPTGDLFVGPVCIYSPSDQAPLDDIGTECKFPNGQGGMTHYTNACVDDAECFLKSMSPMGMGFSSAGDNKCHELCYLAGGASDNPDGGIAGGDAGEAGTCPGNTVCTDIFGLANAGTPQLKVGFCM